MRNSIAVPSCCSFRPPLKWLSLLLLLMYFPAFSQTSRTISGAVVNSEGQPVANATVEVKGSSQAVITDTTGKFRITVPDGNATLSVNHVSYAPQEVAVGDRSQLTITLLTGDKKLDEVVVIGYGTQRRTSLTAAVSSVKGEEIAALPVANLANALGGRVPGVIFKQGSGEPGYDGASILIRGFSTTGNTAPLVIVDGVPRSFQQLDPNSVASFTILKDAAAVAPYGVAGANGVILVTTKRGTSGKAQMTYNGYYGWQNPTQLPRMVNSYDYAVMRNAAAENEGAAPVYGPYALQKFKDGSDPDLYPVNDPLHTLINKNAPMMGHNVSISGGSEKIKYFGALGYLTQDGMWGTTNFKRYNLTSNIDMQVTNTTKMGISLNGRVEDRQFPAVSASSIFYQLYRTPPVAPVLFSNGLWGSYIGRSAYGNVYESGYAKDLRQIMLTQVSLEQKLPLKGLTAKVVFSYDFNDPDGRTVKTWATPIPYYAITDTTTSPYTITKVGSDGPQKPSFNVFSSQVQSFTYQGYLTYNNSFGKSNVGATLVLEARNAKFTNVGAQRVNYNVPIPELNNGSSNANDISNSGMSSETKQRGMIFRATYAYDNKYLFEASGRYDGHFVFAPGQRYQLFPAFSAGWRLSEEGFMKGITWLDNLKIRGSYGESGALPYIGTELAPFQYLSAYQLLGNNAVFGTISTQGLRETSPANPNITWEKAKKTNIGFELSVLKGLFSIEADYFTEKRNDILIANQNKVPAEYGIGLPQTNSAAVSNHGFDMSMGSVYAVNKDLRIGLNANITYAKNKYVQIYELPATYDNPNRRQTGRPINTYFGYHALGLFQQSDDKNGDGIIDPSEYPVAQFGTLRPGDIRYEDVNGDNKIDANDQKAMGNTPTPQLIYGFSPSVTYKGFDLNVLFQGAGAGSFYLDQQAAWPFYNSGSALAASLDYWTPENPDARYPRVLSVPSQNTSQVSDWWLRKVNYLRLKSAEVGYTLPPHIMQRIRLQNIRVYLSGQNLVTWTKEMKDFDPEASQQQGQFYPQQRVITVGLNVTF
ncbi:SusC/RagA family TonB-linked outer membrane protein [Niabella beijingensis]|uniref:SusC/RagA family TonB-linked outer membrane protein n=1 Tax=Niabella beijingensis TaxID=2872700 RepID=UPI001CC09F5E|nr:TonB-dependent receptor [Niabella beijingensis]MBZ4191963.1 TonB-dependent receptor [Niabella beijingensis]